jgi:hypothetical protein
MMLHTAACMPSGIEKRLYPGLNVAQTIIYLLFFSVTLDVSTGQ